MRLAAAALLLLSAATARADDSGATRMRELRLDASSERHSFGVWLFGWGVTSAAAGGLAIGLGHSDERWLGAGVAAVSFGVVNALLAFGLLDLSGEKREAALVLPATDPRALARLREKHLINELESGQFYAVNFGLDFAYTTAGVFMYVLGRERSPEVAWLQGAGISTIVQAAFLFAFDLISWLGANRRAEAFRLVF